LGAAAALQTAVRQFGGECFYCNVTMAPHTAAQKPTRDHVRPKRNGGRDFLHNLVLACDSCNRSKGCIDLVRFRPEDAAEYMKALDEHLVRCITGLKQA
jgi:5-methylcytosine-specific restriction endonuclease McrA